MSRLASKSPYLIQASTPSGVATLDCVLPTTDPAYRFYRILGWLFPVTDAVDLWIRFSNDGGATYRAGASDYNWAIERVTIAAASDLYTADDADAQGKLGLSIGNVAGEFISFDIAIMGAPTASIRTTWASNGHAVSSTPTPHSCRSTGSVVVAAEINNAVRLMFSSGNISSGQVSFYGMY